MQRIVILLLTFVSAKALAQIPVQNIRGTVFEESIEAPLPYASVVIMNTDPLIGTISDMNGNFTIENVPVGRYDIQFSYLGFETLIVKEIVVIAAKETHIHVGMKQQINVLDEVVVKPTIVKESPINPMATVSARMLSIEEAQRYAGGFDDPARLASSFAGVSSNIANNGIVVRGNAPKSLQWKLEGIEIPNPNHFAEVNTFGGGGLTALSSQLLANSDFMTGAFPAEYNNALSGVFDIFMRTGNSQKYENTFQIGAIGIDFASEGPLKKGGRSSYLFNYRYSTLALVSPLLPEEAQGTRYQDISYKMNFPTKKSGVFLIWGIGLIDRSGQTAKTDSTQWLYDQDIQSQDARQFMGATGISHRITLNNSTQWKTTIAATVSGLEWSQEQLNENGIPLPQNQIQNTNWNFVLTSSIKKRLNLKHTNKSGITITGLRYDMLLKDSAPSEGSLVTVVDESGFSSLVSGYTQSSIRFSERITVNAGLNTQWFTLNDRYTLEPRIGATFQLDSTKTLGVAYGLHSRLEKLNYYFSRNPNNPNELINKDLDFSKSHHFVLSFCWNISDHSILKIEPYYQHLFSIPVQPGSHFSFINLQNEWFINDPLENTGKGRNYGVDLTFEKFLTKGYYYMITASAFESEYTGGDAVWRNTLFNRNFLFNLLGGKEWNTGKSQQNTLGLNARISIMGGDRYIPFDENASRSAGDIIYQYDKAYSEQLDPVLLIHFTASYQINHKNRTHEVALKILNATNQPDFFGHRFNRKNMTIDPNLESIMLPNISYKIGF